MKTITSYKVEKTFRGIRKVAQAQVVYRALMELEEVCSDSHEERKVIQEFQKFLSSLNKYDKDSSEFSFIDLGCEK